MLSSGFAMSVAGFSNLCKRRTNDRVPRLTEYPVRAAHVIWTDEASIDTINRQYFIDVIYGCPAFDHHEHIWLKALGIRVKIDAPVVSPVPRETSDPIRWIPGGLDSFGSLVSRIDEWHNNPDSPKIQCAADGHNCVLPHPYQRAAGEA